MYWLRDCKVPSHSEIPAPPQRRGCRRGSVPECYVPCSSRFRSRGGLADDFHTDPCRALRPRGGLFGRWERRPGGAWTLPELPAAPRGSLAPRPSGLARSRLTVPTEPTQAGRGLICRRDHPAGDFAFLSLPAAQAGRLEARHSLCKVPSGPITKRWRGPTLLRCSRPPPSPPSARPPQR